RLACGGRSVRSPVTLGHSYEYRDNNSNNFDFRCSDCCRCKRLVYEKKERDAELRKEKLVYDK
ncbi:MAG: hypothetical protein WC450_07925, partial [Candidatus Omnitrophota bacterium]